MPRIRIAIALTYLIAPLSAGAQEKATRTVAGIRPPAHVIDAMKSDDPTLKKLLDREATQIEIFKHYSPLMEIYIQRQRLAEGSELEIAGDEYILGRANLDQNADVEAFHTLQSPVTRTLIAAKELATQDVLTNPAGYRQLAYVDARHLDADHYMFQYVDRQFLGDVRCLVFDVVPKKNSPGLFKGRIWAEDQNYTIVRINGDYLGYKKLKHLFPPDFYFHFDSWRVNVAPNLWVPSYVYIEESNLKYDLVRHLRLKAQVRFWDYRTTASSSEQELSRILVESGTPVVDKVDNRRDMSPFEAMTAWQMQSANNAVERMEKMGLIAPKNGTEKILDTVLNNLEVTNNIDVDPPATCRILLTSKIESFTIGHTIVVSRGLIDILPDEASLAFILGHELAHISLHHHVNTDFAFMDRVLLDDLEVYRTLVFRRNESEEADANKAAIKFLTSSPYSSQLQSAVNFARFLSDRGNVATNLFNAHWGNSVSTDYRTLFDTQTMTHSNEDEVALPLGSRIKLDPWTNEVEMLHPVNGVSVREKHTLALGITPLFPFLVRAESKAISSGASSKLQ